MRFEFATSNRIVFGPGRVAEIGQLAQPLGRHAWIVVDSLDRSAQVIKNIEMAGIVASPLSIKGEPTIESVGSILEKARLENCDFVIATGGGSALDTGKAVAALLNNPGELIDYLEVIGKGQSLQNPSVPFMAIPTTAGTGSEVTRNAVIGSPDHRVKSSLRSPHMLPRIALVDPELTYSLPPRPTANTGMDALTQLIEPFTSNAPNPLVDAFCREGIPLVARSLLAAYKDGGNQAAREEMSLASMLGGLALANGRLGAVHGLANPIGGMSHAPHGAICARLLPQVMEANIKELRLRAPASSSLSRYTEIARLLTGNESASAEDGTVWVAQLSQALNIRPLSEYGLNPEDFPALVEQSQKANSMKGNSISLSDGIIASLLEAAI